MQPLELLSVSELTAVTDSGGIELNLSATSGTVVNQLVCEHRRYSDFSIADSMQINRSN